MDELVNQQGHVHIVPIQTTVTMYHKYLGRSLGKRLDILRGKFELRRLVTKCRCLQFTQGLHMTGIARSI
jgi:hypothetical protein